MGNTLNYLMHFESKFKKFIMSKTIYALFILVLCLNCSSNSSDTNPTQTETTYFPPNNATTWEKQSIANLGWKQSAVEPLLDFLEQKKSKGFIVLVNGKVVLENYFNNHTATDTWEWNSAGKTLCASTIGIAQQENFLNINTNVSDYLGKSWTNMNIEKEQLITVRNLLTMTSGIDDSKQLVIKSNLNYVADAGTRWAYGNVF